MHKIGNHNNRDVFYMSLSSDMTSSFKEYDNWICLGISKDSHNKDWVNSFLRLAITNGMCEFKGQGSYGEKLHDLCDETMVELEALEGFPFLNIMTTGDNKTSLASAFWECFFATALPEDLDYATLKVVCVSFDGNNYQAELKDFLEKFDNNWIPED